MSTRPERQRPRRAAAARSNVRGGQQTADLVAGIAGVVLLISMFLPWFGPGATLEEAIEKANEITLQAGGEPQASPDVTDNAWQAFSFVDLVLLLTALAGIRAGVAAVARQGSGRPMIGATAITAGLGGVSSLLILYRVINPIGEAGREYGLFIGFFAALGVAVGGWLALERDSRAPPRQDSIGSRPDG